MRLFRPRAPISRKAYYASALLCVVLCLGVWQALSMGFAAGGKALLMPSPYRVCCAALETFGAGPNVEAKIDKLRVGWSGSDAALDRAERNVRVKARENMGILGRDVLVSFLRVTAAFLLAALLGVPIGMMMGSLKVVEAFFQPLVEFVRYVPVPALIPLLIVFFGVDEAPKIMLIFIGTFFQLALMVQDEVRRVPQSMLRAAYTLGATHSEVIRKVMLPRALPGIFDAMRLCNGWAWTWLIVAEIVAANEGLGFRIIKYQRYLQTDRIFLYLIVLGLLGLLLDMGFRMLNRRLFRWNDPHSV